MTDRVSSKRRSAIMSKVKSKDTGPEMVVRRMLHGLGYRYRLHRRELPGSPDLVFPGRRKVIFVHGCFWHGHGCKIGKLPKSKTDYWKPKILANRKRDARNLASLKKVGWSTLVVWQCDLKKMDRTEKKLVEFLESCLILWV